MSVPVYKSLPECEGPKLNPFHDSKFYLEFIRLLSDNDMEGHSHAFEVLIDSRYYALKVV